MFLQRRPSFLLRPLSFTASKVWGATCRLRGRGSPVEACRPQAGFAVVAGLAQVLVVEGAGVDDDQPAALDVLVVDLQGGRIHRDQHVRRVARGLYDAGAEVDLEGRDAEGGANRALGSLQGKSGKVARSLPASAVVRVNWPPVSCMPSPESPAKRTTADSSSWRGPGRRADSCCPPSGHSSLLWQRKAYVEA